MNGTLINDVELRKTKGGKDWLYNKLEVHYGNNRKTFIPFKVFGNNCKKLANQKVGAEIEIEGHLECEKYKDVYQLSCIVESVNVLGEAPKKLEKESKDDKDWENTIASMPDIQDDPDDEDDDLPF